MKIRSDQKHGALIQPLANARNGRPVRVLLPLLVAEELVPSSITVQEEWPAPGFEDTEFGVFMEPGGRSWRDGSSHESTSLRL